MDVSEFSPKLSFLHTFCTLFFFLLSNQNKKRQKNETFHSILVMLFSCIAIFIACFVFCVTFDYQYTAHAMSMKTKNATAKEAIDAMKLKLKNNSTDKMQRRKFDAFRTKDLLVIALFGLLVIFFSKLHFFIFIWTKFALCVCTHMWQYTKKLKLNATHTSHSFMHTVQFHFVH